MATTTIAQQTMKRVIFSGIQPTGVPHIGNHLGALSQWQKLVQQAGQQPPELRDQLFFSVVGLHALTVPQDPIRLKQERKDMFAVLLALGLDTHGTVIFHQDQVPQHTELAWYLNCLTPVNRLMRMTSWKSKLAQLRNANSEDEVDDSLLQLGLLAYPVLQAADVLLYKTTHVPVGHDQAQHLELARDVAQVWNTHYPRLRFDGKRAKGSGVFRIPEVMLTEHPRIQSLRSPTTKMSKSSSNPSSKILLTDPPALIQRKVKSALTDSLPDITWDPTNRPGIAGLLRIHSGYSGEKVESIADRLNDVRELKKEVGEVVSESLKVFRDEYAKIRMEEGYLAEREKDGAMKAGETAEQTMREVRKLVGTD